MGYNIFIKRKRLPDQLKTISIHVAYSCMAPRRASATSSLRCRSSGSSANAAAVEGEMPDGMADAVCCVDGVAATLSLTTGAGPDIDGAEDFCSSTGAGFDAGEYING